MKKPDLKRLLVVALAALAVFIACMPNSVTVFIMPQEGVEPVAPVYCSYFTLLEDITGAVSLPTAGLCACICLMLAGIYAVNKKRGLLTVIKWTAVSGAMLAVALILVRSATTLVVPNVIVPIALMAEFALTHYLSKKTDGAEKKEKINRLK